MSNTMAVDNRAEGKDVSSYPEVGDYFFQTKELHDVHFIVGKEKDQERIPAVRALLINQSPVWLSMLAKYSHEGDIILSDVKPSTFKQLLKHCYGALEDCSGLSGDEVLDLSRCADKYLMSTLKRKIAASLNPKDINEVFHALHCLVFYNVAADNEAVKKIVQNQTLEIFEHPLFLECDDNCITYITRQDCLRCEEIQLWKAVVNWAKHRAGTDEGPKLRKLMLRPLHHIRLLTLSKSDLHKYVFTTNILSGSEIASICKKRNIPKALCDNSEVRKLTKPTNSSQRDKPLQGPFNVDIVHEDIGESKASFGYTTSAYFIPKREDINLKYVTCIGLPLTVNSSMSNDTFKTYCDRNIEFIFQEKDSVEVTITVTHITNIYCNTSDEEPTVINRPGIEFYHFDRFNIPVDIVLRADCKYKIELEFSETLPCLTMPDCENGHEFEHGLFCCSSLYEDGFGTTPSHIVGFEYKVVRDY